MSELSTIPAVQPSVQPASDAIEYSAAWNTQLLVNAPDPNGKKTAKIVLANYNTTLRKIDAVNAPFTIDIPDLDADCAVYPLLGQALGFIVNVEAALAPAKHLELQIVAALADLAKKQSAYDAATSVLTSATNEVTRLQGVLTALNANTTLAADKKASAIANETAALTKAQSAVTAATTSQATASGVLVVARGNVSSLIAQWHTAAAALGTPGTQLPPQLVGITPPAGVTV